MDSVLCTYRLSHRQQKELGNGKVLRIALPNPEDEPDDFEAWARSALEVPDGTLVRGVEQHNLPVSPLHRGRGGLAEVFGELCDSSGMRNYFLTLFVECLVVELSAGVSPRGKLRTQWPGSVRLPNGAVLPAP